MHLGALKRRVESALPDLGGRAGAVHIAAPRVVDGGGVIRGSNPYGGDQLRGAAHHPGVLVGAGVTQLRGTGLGHGLTPVGQRAIGPGRDWLHGVEHVVRDLLGDAPLTAVLWVFVEHLTRVGLDALNEVGVMPHATVGQGGHRGGHVQRAGLVLAQDDAFIRGLAIFGQGLIDSRQAARHAQRVGHIRGVLGLVLKIILQAHEGRVVGVLQRHAQVTHAAAVAVIVLDDLGSWQLIGIRGVHGAQRDTLLQRRGKGHHLEGGAGLERRIGVVPTVSVVAAEVAADGAGCRFDGDRTSTGVLLQRRQVGVHGIDLAVLDLHVNGGGDLQALGGHIILGDANLAEFLDDLVLDVAVRAGCLRVRGVLGRVSGLREYHAGTRGGVQLPHIHEAVKHVVPTLLRLAGVVPWVERRWALDYGRQEGGLFHGQITHVLVEVRAGCRLNAVSVAAEVHSIEVGVKDFFLGPFVGHLDGINQLASLADVRTFVAHQGIFHILLGDGRTAAGRSVAGELSDGRAAETGEGEAVVGPELAVLGGEHGVFNVIGDLL